MRPTSRPICGEHSGEACFSFFQLEVVFFLFFMDTKVVKCILLQLHGHRAVRGGGARLRACLPGREDKRSEPECFITTERSRVSYFLPGMFYMFCWSCTVEHKHLLKNAQLELKKSKRKDYYKVLGVDRNATEEEIKKAYRKRALLHHPGASTHNVLFKWRVFIVQFCVTPLFSAQTDTVVLALRCRRKRRRSSKRSGKLSACCQMRRRGLDMTAVRTWRMTAWTWEVSNGGKRCCLSSVTRSYQTSWS